MTTWTLTQVFRTPTPHGYCYCPRFEDPNSFEGDGRMYVDLPGYFSDRFVAVRRDLVTVPDDEPTVTKSDIPDAWLNVPERGDMPEAAFTFTPSIAAALLRLGISILSDEEGEHDAKRPAHLFLGEDHIGFVMGCAHGAGRTLAQIRTLMRVDEALTEARGENLGPSALAIVGALAAHQIDALMYIEDATAAIKAMAA